MKASTVWAAFSELPGSSHFSTGYDAHLFFKRRALGHAHHNIFLFHYFIVLQRYPLFEIKVGY